MVDDHLLARADGDHLDHDLPFQDRIYYADLFFVGIQLVIAGQIDPGLVAQMFALVGIGLQLLEQLGHFDLPATVQVAEIVAGFADQQDTIKLRIQSCFPSRRPAANGF